MHESLFAYFRSRFIGCEITRFHGRIFSLNDEVCPTEKNTVIHHLQKRSMTSSIRFNHPVDWLTDVFYCPLVNGVLRQNGCGGIGHWVVRILFFVMALKERISFVWFFSNICKICNNIPHMLTMLPTARKKRFWQHSFFIISKSFKRFFYHFV